TQVSAQALDMSLPDVDNAEFELERQPGIRPPSRTEQSQTSPSAKLSDLAVEEEPKTMLSVRPPNSGKEAFDAATDTARDFDFDPGADADPALEMDPPARAGAVEPDEVI